jgi:hypothetical protein
MNLRNPVKRCDAVKLGTIAAGHRRRNPLLHLVGPAAVRFDRLQADVRHHLDLQ